MSGSDGVVLVGDKYDLRCQSSVWERKEEKKVMKEGE